ncbi:tetratricopeptide repeat protein [Brevibacillus parabrevis]|uniref:tetratricopeptide repeat protein n=1 Tax=Brevibacillus parabrevis TaxID=54914 RepID=UPI002E23A42E|nr:tetratricopeptide repeat protein [Brevibacillus parabrevis]
MAISEQERTISAIVKLANHYWDMGKNEAALEQAMEALRIAPDHCDALRIAGWNCYNLNRYEEALQYAAHWIGLQPDNYYGYRLAGLIYRDTKRYDDSVEVLKHSVELDPQEAMSYYHLAVSICYQAEDNYGDRIIQSVAGTGFWNKGYKAGFEQARELLQTSIQLNPEYGWSYAQLAYVNGTLGFVEEAERNSKAALEIEPSNPTFLARHADVLYYLGKLEEAKQAVDAALEIDPEYRFASELQETISKSQADYFGYLHRMSFKSAVYANLYRDRPDIYLRSIQLMLMANRFSPIKELKKYLKLEPDNLEMNMHYGRLLYLGRKYKKAVAHFQKCAERFPGQPQVEDWLQKASEAPAGFSLFKLKLGFWIRAIPGHIVYFFWLILLRPIVFILYFLLKSLDALFQMRRKRVKGRLLKIIREGDPLWNRRNGRLS